jgi:hypothetical protein
LGKSPSWEVFPASPTPPDGDPPSLPIFNKAITQ